MLVEFLTAEQAAEYGRLNGPTSRDESETG
jgi:hypothetical protein